MQYAKPEDTSQTLSPSKKKYIQEVIGAFLCYGRVVDSTMLTALSTIASAQAKPTEETMTCCKQFFDYAATHHDAILTYIRSDMVFVIHSEASYLSKPKVHSQASGHFFLSSDCNNPVNNGTVLNLAQLIKAVMTSTAEADWAHSTSTHVRLSLTNNTCRNGPQTAPNSHTVQQYHSPWSREQQHTFTTH